MSEQPNSIAGVSPWPAILPRPEAPKPVRGWYRYAATGHFLAVEFTGPWPTLALGPFSALELGAPLDSLDWSKAMADHGLNVRFLIPIDAAEMAFIKSGRKRTATPTPARGSGTGPASLALARAGITQE